MVEKMRGWKWKAGSVSHMQHKKGSGTMILDEMGHGKRESKKKLLFKVRMKCMTRKKNCPNKSIE